MHPIDQSGDFVADHHRLQIAGVVVGGFWRKAIFEGDSFEGRAVEVPSCEGYHPLGDDELPVGVGLVALDVGLRYRLDPSGLCFYEAGPKTAPVGEHLEQLLEEAAVVGEVSLDEGVYVLGVDVEIGH